MTDLPRADLDKINGAAKWLADNWEEVRLLSLTALLRERFGLGFNHAAKAMAEAKRIRGSSNVSGGRR